jgi:ATP-dependent helicase/nuclease subunit A
MSPRKADPVQAAASDPRASAFVAAHAGSGKTSTLVDRVARLLLAGSPPETILCVTFTKAAAAEMQRRLFEKLGAWAVMADEDLTAQMAGIGEGRADLGAARALFARALDTPGGLKILTIHAFCEALLRRFPLEAGLSPGFTVLDDAAGAAIDAQCREALAEAAAARAGGPLHEAYAHLSVELGWGDFHKLLQSFRALQSDLAAYLDGAQSAGGVVGDIWRRCGFDAPASLEAIEAAALARCGRLAWNRAAEALAASAFATDRTLAEAMSRLRSEPSFAALRKAFCTDKGDARSNLGRGVAADIADTVLREQQLCLEACERLRAAKVALDTQAAMTLAAAYLELYAGAKEARRALDFGDIIERAADLLTRRSDAAWVLFKLDGGLEHVLLDEAQDTAPAQWTVIEALTAEFFAGAASRPAPRTMFAVGDEKQSIFSFQGAEPERLAAERESFRATVTAAGQTFRGLQLATSYRSRPEVLRLVDTICAAPEILAGLRPAGRNVQAMPIAHRAVRPEGGCVELWPLEPKLPEPEVDVWAPVDQVSPSSPGARLADRIAREVALAVARGEAVGGREPDSSRPCGFGDVLILVRRRNALFHEIIRALKRHGIPVAGADRFKLSEHGVHEDLMSLGRIARFVFDDLCLAEVLRGPFCDVSEDSLFDLAHARRATLWGDLRARSGERGEWAGAATLIESARDLASLPPFEFYNRFLALRDLQGRSMRQRLMTRMGVEGEDALNAFLAQALAAERRGVLDMEGFLAAMTSAEVEIKREMDSPADGGAGQVRVMTVHGAKGLEAPIVILPDTSIRTTDQGGPLLPTADGGFLFAPRAGEDCVASAAARAERTQGVQREASRLLYVALTRARDRLVVAGVETAKAWFRGSWREAIEQAWSLIETRPFALADGAVGSRHGPDPQVAAAAPAAPQPDAVLPAWSRQPADPQAVGRSSAPSRLTASADRAPSPLARLGGLGRYRRGEIIHRLLERLPDVAPDRRAAAAARSLAREADLSEDQRAEMAMAALSVIEDPGFAAVFGPGSRAEVAIGGGAASLPPNLKVSGRIDRLVVLPRRVLIIDFKTNRPAPADIDHVEPAYILQMAIYTAVLGELYPDRSVEAALVWTDGPRLMAVPPDVMRAAIARL